MATPAARVQLAQMVDQAAPPALSDTELNTCLDAAALADPDGHPPADPEWTPTYDMYQAAADTCELRAAKAASSENLTSVTSEGTTLQTSPADWTAMARWWRLHSRACAGSHMAGVIGIDSADPVDGRPRSSYTSPDTDWGNLPPQAIPGAIGNWS